MKKKLNLSNLYRNPVETAKKPTLNALFKSLDSIESRITFICQSKGISANDLESHLDRFSEDGEDVILQLLKEKLSLQETIYKRQGGSLDNVVFLASHR